MRRWGAMVAAVVLLAGCATAGDEARVLEVEPPRFEFEDAVRMNLNMARDLGASEAQIALLEQARDEGFVSQALAVEARQNFFACLGDNGVRYNDLGVNIEHEFGSLPYGVADSPLGDWCYEYEYGEIDGLYQTQPLARQSRAALLGRQLPQIMDCLHELSVEIVDNPTYDELRRALTFIDPAVPHDASRDSVQCLERVGLDPNEVL